MFCESCGRDMVPRKDVVCPSGTDTCSAPSWYCDSCYTIKYVHSDKEFDYWIERYLLVEDEDYDDKFGAFDVGGDTYEDNYN